MTRRVIHFDVANLAKLICDNKNCDYNMKLGEAKWGEHLIDYPCPKCQKSLLTKEDFLSAEKTLSIFKWINFLFSWIPFVGCEEKNATHKISGKTINGKTTFNKPKELNK